MKNRAVLLLAIGYVASAHSATFGQKNNLPPIKEILDRARGDAIQIRDEYEKIQSIRKIARLYYKLSERVKSRKMFSEAFKVAENLKPIGQRNLFKDAILYDQACEGDVITAFLAAQKFITLEDRNYVLGKIASLACYHYEFEMANEIAKRISVGEYQDDTFSTIALYLISAGMFEESEQFLADIKNDEHRTNTFQYGIGCLAMNGKYSLVENSFKLIKNPAQMILALIKLSTIQLEDGLRIEAKKTYRRIFKTLKQVPATKRKKLLLHEDLLDAEIRFGDHATVLKKILKQPIKDRDGLDKKNRFLVKVAENYTKAGRVQDALKLQKHIKGTDEYGFLAPWSKVELGEGKRSREELEIRIACELAKNGNLEQALTLIATVEDIEQREKAFHQLSVILAEQGNFKKAIPLLHRIQNPNLKSAAIKKLVENHSQILGSYQSKSLIQLAMNLRDYYDYKNLVRSVDVEAIISPAKGNYHLLGFYRLAAHITEQWDEYRNISWDKRANWLSDVARLQLEYGDKSGTRKTFGKAHHAAKELLRIHGDQYLAFRDRDGFYVFYTAKAIYFATDEFYREVINWKNPELRCSALLEIAELEFEKLKQQLVNTVFSCRF